MKTQLIVGPYQDYPGQVLTTPSIAPVLLDEDGADIHEWWVPVEDAPGYYVSSRGRVNSVKNGGVRTLSPYANPKNGYLGVTLTVNGKNKFTPVHKLVATAFHGPCPEGMTVDHIDGDKTNNDAGNLQYISGADNTKKFFRTGKRYTRKTTTRNTVEALNENGDVVFRFSGAKEASEFFAVSEFVIRYWVKSRKTTYFGLTWRYADRCRVNIDGSPIIKQNKRLRPVVAINPDGTVFKEFSSVTEASKEIGRARQNLRNALNGRAEQCAGYFWKYKTTQI